jgi:ATP-dependent DNA helicase DinG
MPTSKDILSANGLLSQAVPDFTPREAQIKMAQAIEQALALESPIVIEAGTGTGKTYGYLVPIFLAQEKTIISTGTKNLQDQLFFKDIPIIKQLFPVPHKIVLLKGRANYLCQYRLERSLEDGRFASRQLVTQLHLLREWGRSTQTGDIAEAHDVPEDSAIWPSVTSTADNCLNQDCEFYKSCFVVKARQEAMAADIVVVNHHLFFADMALQDEGFGEILPGAKIVIFDEAHHLPDIASQFFSTIITGRQLIELARDSESEASLEAKDAAEIPERGAKLQTAVHEMRLALGNEIRRAPWPEALSSSLKNAINTLKSALAELETTLKINAVRSKALENCWRRAGEFIARLDLLTGPTPENTIHWFETHTQSFSIQLTPMIVAEQFKNYMQNHQRSHVFTSATLTVKNNFNLFVDALGLNKATQLQLKSPFDYQKQALLYVPRGLPDPHTPHFTEAMMEAVIPVLELLQGKTFVLFTSHKAMEYAALLLKGRIPFPILQQGTASKQKLITEFKNLGNAVLLGTSSFWYGVDVRGDALSCVIIDKLPFAAPEDPILRARIQMLRKQGVDPFTTYQLPNAVLTLKQGAGRLIRDQQDRGILMICDPRIVGSRYGETFLQSLPDMPRTREFSKVVEFFCE